MSGVEKIQAAEANVAQMQDALATVQSGLERAETVAVAAEEAKERSERAFQIVVGLLGVTLLVLFVSLRRRRRRS